MPRLARLLTQYVPFRSSGRLRGSRHDVHGAAPCAAIAGEVLPSRTLPLFAVARGLDVMTATTARSDTLSPPGGWSRRRAVRVYEGPSRIILVGKIDAVCGMIDRYIADERAGKWVPFER